MTAYYNENDPKIAAWLRELIKAGLIAPGDVDERSIEDVRGTDLAGYTQCHFFAGIGGWSLALRLAGWPDDRPVWTGSCPCQPFSAAGKRKGAADKRHLWPHFHRLIAECRPPVIFGEQVASSEVVGTELEASFVIAVQKGDYARANKLAKRLAQSNGFHFWPRWVDGIQADMAAEHYTFWFKVLGAHSVNAPHIRQRLFWVADRGINQCSITNGLPREWAAASSPRPNRDGISPSVLGPGSRRMGNAKSGGNGAAPFAGSDCESEAEGRQRGVGGPGSSSGLAQSECTGVWSNRCRTLEAAASGMQEPNGQWERLWPDAGAVCGGESVGMANASIARHARAGEGKGVDGDRSHPLPQRQLSQLESAGSSPACGMEHPAGDGRDARRSESGGRGIVGGCGGSGLRHAMRTGLEAVGAEQAGIGSAGKPGFWSDYILIPCADRKARRLKPGIEPLAHGISGRMAVVRTRQQAGIEVQETHWYSRRAALHGFGNAIVPQVAAEFIEAYRERRGLADVPVG